MCWTRVSGSAPLISWRRSTAMAPSLPDSPRLRPRKRSVASEHEPARRYAGAGGDQDVRGAVHLVDAGATHLPDRLGDAVHPVDVGLTELAAVRVDRQPSAQLDRPVRDEARRLAAAAAA